MNTNFNMINRINLINDKLLTIGLIPTSYLLSMSYEEQLLWLSNYLENTLIPKINELITTFNTDTELLENALNDVIDLANALREEMQDLEDEMDNLDHSVDTRLEEFMNSLSDNLNTIANAILTEKIANGELIVSLGIDYNENTKALTFSIESQTSAEIIEDLSSLTTP